MSEREHREGQTCTAGPSLRMYEPELVDPSLTIPCTRPAVCRVITITGWYGGVYCQGHADAICSTDLDAGPVSLDVQPKRYDEDQANNQLKA